MKKGLPYFFLILIIGLATSCGKKGPLSLPVARIPQTVEDFALIQRGEKFLLSWMNPTAYLDGQPLGSVAEVEVWLMVEPRQKEGRNPVSLEEFKRKATVIRKLSPADFFGLAESKRGGDRSSFIFEPRENWNEPRVYTFSLRVRDERGRCSDYSKLLSIEKHALPQPPRDVRATLFEDHIHLTWEAPLQNVDGSTPPLVVGYHVYRAEAKSNPVRLTSFPVGEKEYKDRDISLERVYRYFVRAVASLVEPVLESDDSDAVEVRVVDTFPPAPPTGLTAVAGPGYVALSWQPCPESDLAGYRIWRREAGQEEFKMIASVVSEENTYLDGTVEKSRGYDYAITALDRTGNESRKSEKASVFVRQEVP